MRAVSCVASARSRTLDVKSVSHAVEELKILDLQSPPEPPTRAVVKPRRRQVTKKEEGTPAKKAGQAPLVRPLAQLPLPSPVPVAQVAGSGSTSTSGTGTSDSGTGAGTAGHGFGGGNEGAYTPARKLTKIPDREYRRFAATGISSGTVAISIRVDPDGTVSNCRVMRSSGSGYADALMCQLTVQYVRFSPARDPSGHAIAQDVTWVPNWAPR